MVMIPRITKISEEDHKWLISNRYQRSKLLRKAIIELKNGRLKYE